LNKERKAHIENMKEDADKEFVKRVMENQSKFKNSKLSREQDDENEEEQLESESDSG
jgi:hypothetical protein